jgi:tetratricopeptide (TPR) repeat protein
MRELVAVGIVGAAMLWGAPVAAQRAADDFDRPRPTAEQRRRAVELYESSTHALRSGDFERAVGQLHEAYELSPQPALLEALGRAYEGLGDVPNAIQHYREYLEADPDASNRGEIEGRIEELELRQREAEHRPPPPPPPAPSGPDETGPLVGYVMLGLGGASLVVGGVLAGVAASERSVSEDPASTQAQAFAAHGRAADLGTAATVLLAAGGALGLTGVVIAIASADQPAPTSDRSRPRTALRFGPASVALEGTF